ncbi:alanyl-tRNA editing protein [Candidatus Bathyarchaeota archaeon]|jgi:alanyl-tRNA synthetase|nr:alanyl-tRNA editing protein [Candidatus Bathyarchaeota archaeon]MBT4320899.1 alanyl-tRNA editing protein [Candidatus Bathyarchaeota archaeon]MBT4423172.1 alanyl-tRNA editing protein [Candidatus Bathyarchaeota archaeon]MBT5642431.1 alanyl-tRNA editing protein [Candidatus Bathyarchaeota archaeon]MBT6605965.1 alanyl-tRNA editing protein [Candidatus Bathyarchaeota archaeon]
MSDEVRAHTALHIIKGAIVKVLGEDANWSTSANVKDLHGRIAVEFNRKPTVEEIAEIGRQANAKVTEDAEVEIHNMSRSEAETRWGDLIYDKWPLPDHIQQVKVFHLPGWNVNCCGNKHTERTGAVGSIKITKTRYRNSKNVLEVSYDVED